MPCIHHILQQKLGLHSMVQYGSHIHLFLVNWKYLPSF